MANMDNLFNLMIERGITAKELSVATGISTGNISDWKSGRSAPAALKLIQLAKYFDVSTDYLLGLIYTPSSAGIIPTLTSEERRLLAAYRAADSGVKASILKLLDLEDCS